MTNYKRIKYKKLDILKDMDTGAIKEAGVDAKALEEAGGPDAKLTREITEEEYADYIKQGHKITEGTVSDLTKEDIEYIKTITPKEYWR